jgi:hypothetical protein
VVALAWVGVVGWREYAGKPWNLDWGTNDVRVEGECWDKLAKWPDGQPFTVDDSWADEYDAESNVEINRKVHAWAADSIPERNKWRAAIRQKLRDCEGGAPVTQRLSLKVSRIWSSLEDSLPILLLPPLALLIAGFIVRWVAKGFTTAASLPGGSSTRREAVRDDERTRPDSTRRDRR